MVKNYLSNICQSLLQEAKEHPGVTQEKTLRRGLLILIRKNTFGTDIAIGRKEVYPSEEEWSIVLREFGLTELEKRKVTMDRWSYLVGFFE